MREARIADDLDGAAEVDELSDRILLGSPPKCVVQQSMADDGDERPALPLSA